jgi:hypothetical protein
MSGERARHDARDRRRSAVERWFWAGGNGATDIKIIPSNIS